jgi:hypothetical protein
MITMKENMCGSVNTRCLQSIASKTMNTIKTVLTITILTLFLANCVQLDFIVNCKTVGPNKNIKENKEAPDKSWSVTIANQDTYKSSISTTSMMVPTRKTKTIKYDRLVLTYLCSFEVRALLQDPQGYLGGPGFGSGAYEFVRRMLHRYVNTSLSYLIVLKAISHGIV